MLLTAFYVLKTIFICKILFLRHKIDTFASVMLQIYMSDC